MNQVKIIDMGRIMNIDLQRRALFVNNILFIYFHLISWLHFTVFKEPFFLEPLVFFREREIFFIRLLILANVFFFFCFFPNLTFEITKIANNFVILPLLKCKMRHNLRKRKFECGFLNRVIEECCELIGPRLCNDLKSEGNVNQEILKKVFAELFPDLAITVDLSRVEIEPREVIMPVRISDFKKKFFKVAQEVRRLKEKKGYRNNLNLKSVFSSLNCLLQYYLKALNLYEDNACFDVKEFRPLKLNFLKSVQSIEELILSFSFDLPLAESWLGIEKRRNELIEWLRQFDEKKAEIFKKLLPYTETKDRFIDTYSAYKSFLQFYSPKVIKVELEPVEIRAGFLFPESIKFYTCYLHNVSEAPLKVIVTTKFKGFLLSNFIYDLFFCFFSELRTRNELALNIPPFASVRFFVVLKDAPESALMGNSFSKRLQESIIVNLPDKDIKIEPSKSIRITARTINTEFLSARVLRIFLIVCTATCLVTFLVLYYHLAGFF